MQRRTLRILNRKKVSIQLTKRQKLLYIERWAREITTIVFVVVQYDKIRYYGQVLTLTITFNTVCVKIISALLIRCLFVILEFKDSCKIKRSYTVFIDYKKS